jgi:hypothetical protein
VQQSTAAVAGVEHVRQWNGWRLLLCCWKCHRLVFNGGRSRLLERNFGGVSESAFWTLNEKIK